MPARKSQPSPKPPRLNMMLIVADIHDRTGIPKEYISATLRGFKELVRDSMAAGVDIDMGADFGKFVAIEVAGREPVVSGGAGGSSVVTVGADTVGSGTEGGAADSSSSPLQPASSAAAVTSATSLTAASGR